MSPKLSVMKPLEVVKLLERHGFYKISQSGSHLKMRNDAKITIIVPIHQGKDIKIGLLSAILKKAGINF